MMHGPSFIKVPTKSIHQEWSKRERSKQQWRMRLGLLSRAVKAREVMGSAVTDLPQLELIH